MNKYQQTRSRRAFLKNSVSLVAASMVPPLLTSALPMSPTADALPEDALLNDKAAPIADNLAPISDKAAPLIGIQVGPESFVDEGVEPLLDWLQERAGVNTISLTTFTYGQGFAGRLGPGRLFPGHGGLASTGAPFHGGNFAIPHAKFYTQTVLKDTKAPDHGSRVVLEEVLQAARKRGMKVFCGVEDRWDRAFDVPGLQECAEVDLQGRSTFDRSRSITTCVFNPNVRAFWTALTTDLCSSYEIDGLLFENERSGPLMNVLGATPFRATVGDTSHVTCFCTYHQQAAAQRGIDFQRAKQGYTRLYDFVRAALKDQRPPDGYYVTFQQILRDFPEIEAYDRLFDEGKLRIVEEMRAAMKAVRKDLQLIFHIEQTISFNPFTRAALNYEQLSGKAEFLKPATYNNCAGERYANFVRTLGTTVFKDMPQDELFTLLNHWLNYEGLAPLAQLPTAGLPAGYIGRETRRALAGVKGRCGILPGIDISIPVAEGSRIASPEDSYAATFAALEAGAQGVILSRKYSEMRRENLEGAGRAIREWRTRAGV
jgi:hypothetical protein